MKSATALGVTLTLVIGSFAWYAARAQEVAAPVPGSDARSEVAPAPVPAPTAWPTVKPMTVVTMVDGKPVYETRTVVEAAPGTAPYGFADAGPGAPSTDQRIVKAVPMPTLNPGAAPRISATSVPPGATYNGPAPMPIPTFPPAGQAYAPPPMISTAPTAPMPGRGANSGGFDIFMPRGGEVFRKPIDEETAKQLNADRELSSQLTGAVERYKNSDEGQKADVSNAIREVVSKQFDVRQHLRERELAELEARLGKLRELHAKRQQEKDRIINDRVQQVLRDADGLGWGDATPGDNMFYFRTGGPSADVMMDTARDAAPPQEMQFKIQAAIADAARQDFQKAAAASQGATKQIMVAVDLMKDDKMKAAMEAADRAIETAKAIAPGEARDQAVREAEQARQETEQARLEAMKAVMEAQEEAKHAAEEAQKDAARQDRESKDESWEEKP